MAPKRKNKNRTSADFPARRCRNQSSYPVNVNLNEFVFYINELAGTSKKIFL